MTRPATPTSDGGETAATLVVGFDGTVESVAALRAAADLGERLEAHLVVVHAVDLSDYPVDPDADDYEQQAEKVVEADRGAVTAALRDYRPGWSFRALRAAPADALRKVADERAALMIVVGFRVTGTHVVDHLLAPAVPSEIIRRSGRPVLVVGAHA